VLLCLHQSAHRIDTLPFTQLTTTGRLSLLTTATARDCFDLLRIMVFGQLPISSATDNPLGFFIFSPQ
jgi:hypothetical protein